MISWKQQYFLKKKMEEKPESGLQEKIKELKEIKESCHKVEEDLEDEINDKFSSISVLLEERRRNVVSQLRSQVSGKCQRIGQWSVVRPVLWSPSLYQSFRGPNWGTGGEVERLWDHWWWGRLWPGGPGGGGGDAPRHRGLGWTGGGEAAQLQPGSDPLVILHSSRIHCR